MSAEKFDSLGLRAIFLEFASKDPAVNQSVVNAVALATTPIGGSVFKRGA